MTSEISSNWERGSESRRDTSSATGGPDWIQVGFSPPEHLEATIRLLYNANDRVARYQVELSNPVTKELLGMRARPFHTCLSAQEAYEQACQWGHEAIAATMNPDPF